MFCVDWSLLSEPVEGAWQLQSRDRKCSASDANRTVFESVVVLDLDVRFALFGSQWTVGRAEWLW